MAKRKYEQMNLRIEGRAIPVRVYRERRPNFRASIGKRSVILRLPLLLAPGESSRVHRWLEDWLTQQFRRRPALLERFSGSVHEDGQVIQVGDRSYRLSLTYSDRATNSARLREGLIDMHIDRRLPPLERKRAIQTLLSRVIGRDFLPAITTRVHELNDRYFQQPIQGVRLKYNHSNWGSCSRAGNINLSTRLLFAPPDVIDYVIIHELAHRLEMNHSPRFWSLVAAAMPGYQEKITWLRTHGKDCDF